MKLAIATALVLSSGLAMAAGSNQHNVGAFGPGNNAAPAVQPAAPQDPSQYQGLTINSTYSDSAWSVDNAAVNGSIDLGSSTVRGAVVDINR